MCGMGGGKGSRGNKPQFPSPEMRMGGSALPISHFNQLKWLWFTKMYLKSLLTAMQA